MAIRGESLTVQYTATNISTNGGQSGDAGNHTLRVNTDGISAVPTNTPVEVDAVFEPGEYSLLLAAGEMNGNFIKLTGLSSTPNVRIVPLSITTERGLMPQNPPWTDARAAKLDFLDAFISSRMPAGGGGSGGGGGGSQIGSVAGVFAPSQIYLGMQDRLSVTGVALRLDDVPPHDFADVFFDAGNQIDEHVWQRYSPNALSGSRWVYERYCDLAAYLLCERRDNPPGPGMSGKWKRAMKSLEKVQMGQMAIPNIAPRKSEAPVLVGTRTALYPYPRPVVERSLSTGRADGYQQYLDKTENASDYTI